MSSNRPDPPLPFDEPTLGEKVRRVVVGKPRELKDKRIFHSLSLVAFLAWVGLGADGLSSSSYGPEEAYKTLREHTYLAPALALLVAVTVFVISAAYTRIIQEFPQGGGGYVVASKLLGPRWGLLSGSALLVDYVLTVTVSIAAAGDALFSFLPHEWAPWKFWVEAVLILLLTALNIRGVKESVVPLTPVFVLFLVTHAVVIVGSFATHTSEIGERAESVRAGFDSGLQTLGVFGMLKLFVHAFSMGGGTFTGLEAVSNGLPIMREPRVQTANRTMVYMAFSLAITAAGLLLCYLLWDVGDAWRAAQEHGRTMTMNAVLLESLSAQWGWGRWFTILTLLTEALLLVVAAQAGFLDGPRVLANMAVDSWVPRRFAALSERLTTHNGVLLMGASALVALAATHGVVDDLVVMYSINVFLTFSLSMFAMMRFVHATRRDREHWHKRFALFVVGFVLCFTILVITIVEKLPAGGWRTIAVTGGVVALCMLIRRHYDTVSSHLRNLYATLEDLPISHKGSVPPVEPKACTAAVFVVNYGGVGIHTVLNVLRAFPGHYRQLVFCTVGVVDSGAFKGEREMDALHKGTEAMLRQYVELANRMGVAATQRMRVGTAAVAEAVELGREVAREFPRTTFFAGYVLFQRERWYQRLLHNETAFAIQRRLQWAGLTMVILPARVQSA
jgi:amino acid transporter